MVCWGLPFCNTGESNIESALHTLTINSWGYNSHRGVARINSLPQRCYTYMQDFRIMEVTENMSPTLAIWTKDMHRKSSPSCTAYLNVSYCSNTYRSKQLLSQGFLECLLVSLPLSLHTSIDITF